jgi:hypothetical protein
VLTNIDLIVPAQRSKRLGYTIIADDIGSDPAKVLMDFARQGDTDYLLQADSTNIRSWTYNATVWTSLATISTTTLSGYIPAKGSGLTPDDILIFQNGTDNAKRIHIASNETVDIQDLGDTNTSPEKTTVMAWYGNRVWTLKNDKLGYSDAYDDDYSGAFDRATNWFRVPVGQEKALVATRDLGIVCFGKDEIWSVIPSPTPVATDSVQPIITSYGCVAGATAVVVGDDIYWLAPDGVRALKRTAQDKLQAGASYPLSYQLRNEFNDISWAYAEKACAVYYDNRYMLALPVGGSTYNNKVWVYYPATSGWSVWDLNVGSWAVHTVNGKDLLYFSDSNNGVVYQMFSGKTDNGDAIAMTEESREYDLGQKQVEKTGGWVEVEAASSGDSNSLSVSISLDGGAYSSLGTMNLESSTAPTLPISLPFELSDVVKVREKFHLDHLGPWRTIKVKIENTDANVDEIRIDSVNLVAFADQIGDEIADD